MSSSSAVIVIEVSSHYSNGETGVVHHLPKKSGNFGWNVNGKTIFFFPNGNFHGKTKFLER